MRVRDTHRHQRLARPTFADNAYRPRSLESFRKTRNRQCLRRQRLAWQGGDWCGNRIIRALEGGTSPGCASRAPARRCGDIGNSNPRDRSGLN